MGKFPFGNFGNLVLSFITFSNIIYNKQEAYDQLTSRTTWNAHYDYIVVGGGTAGSVLASRLAEDESITVALLEAGGSETVASNTPGLQDSLLGSVLDWKISSVPQNHSCLGMIDRRCLLSSGRVLGGTSSINRMYYLRGNPSDYDRWEQKFGLKFWSWKDILPYIVRNENQTDPERARTGHFGVSGPMQLERQDLPLPPTPPHSPNILDTFVYSSKLLGYRLVDFNIGVPNGTSVLQTMTRTGRRMSTSTAFLEPHHKRRQQNLHILSNSYVYQILFDHQQAIGVRFYRNWRNYTLYARQEILIAAGTINSAKLLLLSGIGPADELRRHKIPIVAELPVGENFHDHVGTHGVHFTYDAATSSSDTTDFDAPFPTSITSTGDGTGAEASINQLLNPVNKQSLKLYFQTGKGPLSEARYAATMLRFNNETWNNNKQASSYHYMYGSLPQFPYHRDSPDMMLLSYQHPITDKELTAKQLEQRTHLRKEFFLHLYGPNRGKPQFTILPVVLKPKSRGIVKLKSTNPLDMPLVNPNYLGEKQDLDQLVEAIREAFRLISQTRPFRVLHTQLFRELVPGCEHLMPNLTVTDHVRPEKTSSYNPTVPTTFPLLSTTLPSTSANIITTWQPVPQFAPNQMAHYQQSLLQTQPLSPQPSPSKQTVQITTNANRILTSILTRILQPEALKPIVTQPLLRPFKPIQTSLLPPLRPLSLPPLGGLFSFNRLFKSNPLNPGNKNKRNRRDAKWDANDNHIDYEQYWLQSDTTPHQHSNSTVSSVWTSRLNTINRFGHQPMVDGFGINSAVESMDTEFETVWNNHKIANHRPLLIQIRPQSIDRSSTTDTSIKSPSLPTTTSSYRKVYLHSIPVTMAPTTTTEAQSTTTTTPTTTISTTTKIASTKRRPIIITASKKPLPPNLITKNTKSPPRFGITHTHTNISSPSSSPKTIWNSPAWYGTTTSTAPSTVISPTFVTSTTMDYNEIITTTVNTKVGSQTINSPNFFISSESALSQEQLQQPSSIAVDTVSSWTKPSKLLFTTMPTTMTSSSITDQESNDAYEQILAQHNRPYTETISTMDMPPVVPVPPTIAELQAASSISSNSIGSSSTGTATTTTETASIENIPDEYLRCMAQVMTAPIGNYVGTCRMGGDNDHHRVVDGRFRVIGVQGLRVVDASVVPEITTGALAAVAMMIGERGAEMVLEDLRGRSNVRKNL